MSRRVKYIYSDNLIQEADKNPAVKGRVRVTAINMSITKL